MIIKIKLNGKIDKPNLYESAFKYSAAKRIIKYPMKADDLVMNEYLKKIYKIDLKTLCIDLVLTKLDFNCDIINGAFIGKFKTPQSEILAELITYGNLDVHGSPILLKLFSIR